jgi:hypothetical protein
MTGLLYASFINELTNSGGGGPLTTFSDVQPYLWAALMLLHAIVAGVLWMMAISSFRVRAR